MKARDHSDFLFTDAGEAYLVDSYIGAGLSTHAIAAARGTYANLVRRAMLFHGIGARGPAEAQRLALKSGRSVPVNPKRGECQRVEDIT